MVFPVVFLCVVAVFEFGLAFRSYLTTSDAALDGARSASASADDADADARTLAVVRNSLDTIPRGEIVQVVVFEAERPAERLTSTARLAPCLRASVPGVCNHYTAADLDAPASRFGCGSGALDAAWCPTTRRATRSTGVALVGVFVRVAHRSATGLVGTTFTIDQQSVHRIEARRL